MTESTVPTTTTTPTTEPTTEPATESVVSTEPQAADKGEPTEEVASPEAPAEEPKKESEETPAEEAPATPKASISKRRTIFNPFGKPKKEEAKKEEAKKEEAKKEDHEEADGPKAESTTAPTPAETSEHKKKTKAFSFFSRSKVNLSLLSIVKFSDLTIFSSLLPK